MNRRLPLLPLLHAMLPLLAGVAYAGTPSSEENMVKHFVDKATQRAESSSFQPLTLSLDPFSFLYRCDRGLYVVQPKGVYLLQPHHGLYASPSFANRYLGLEAGYRYYTGTSGAAGLFVGSTLAYTKGIGGGSDNLGLGFMAGWQKKHDNGLTWGVSLEARYLFWAGGALDSACSLLPVADVGWSF